MGGQRTILALVLLRVAVLADWDDVERFAATIQETHQLSDMEDARVIFVLGRAPANVRPEAFRHAVERGATLVVASESATVNPLLLFFSLKIESETVTCGPARGFRKQSDCPLVTAFERRRLPELFTEVTTLATNIGKEVTGEGMVLARYPRYSLFSGSFWAAPAVFLRWTTLGRGAVFVLGDQSAFIDLLIDEADNRRFLRNLLNLSFYRWRGEKTACVLVDGRSLNAATGPPESPAPHLPHAPFSLPDLAPDVADVNNLLADLQASLPVRQYGITILPILLLMGALILFLLLLREVLNTYVPPEAVPGMQKSRRSERRGMVLAARRLVSLAPPENHARLLRAARRAGRPARYRRFLTLLEKELTHEPPDA